MRTLHLIRFRFAALWVPVLAGLALVLADSRPAHAGVTCTQSLLACYSAAGINGQDWLDMWARGMDCELDFVDCGEHRLRGVSEPWHVHAAET